MTAAQRAKTILDPGQRRETILKGVKAMKLKCAVIQRYDDGKWIDASVRYVLRGLKGALQAMPYMQSLYPHSKLRIVRRTANFDFDFGKDQTGQ